MELPSTSKVTKNTDKSNEAKNVKMADDPLSVTVDPLSGSLASDPLTAALIDPLASSPNTSNATGIFDVAKVTCYLYITSVKYCSKGSSQSSNDLDSTFEPWSIKRTMILANYTTSEKLSITTVSRNHGNNVS